MATEQLVVTLEEETVKAVQAYLRYIHMTNKEFSEEEVIQEINVLARIGAAYEIPMFWNGHLLK